MPVIPEGYRTLDTYRPQGIDPVAIFRGVPYLGIVATRCTIPNFTSTSNKQANAQSMHIARDNITSLQVAYANWYSDAATHENGSGGTMTFTAAIQYPIGGTWQQFKWSGSPTSPTIADGGQTPLTDVLNLATAIPNGAAFLLRVFVTGSNGLIFWYSSNSNHQTSYDLYEQAASGLADKTTSGAAISNNANTLIRPVLIVANTRRPSLLLLGDSRVVGYNDVPDGNGDVGTVARSLGPNFGYVNAATTAERLTDFLTANARRIALGAYASHVVCNGSINDLSSRTDVQLLGDIATTVGLFPNQPVFWTTIEPKTGSSDSYVTTANQTPDATAEPRRVLVNRSIRRNALSTGVSLGLAGVFDVTSIVEPSADSGKYIVAYNGSGTGVAITADGIHLNSTGYLLVRNSTLISPTAITRGI